MTVNLRCTLKKKTATEHVDSTPAHSIPDLVTVIYKSKFYNGV